MTNKFGKAICVALYTAFGALAAKKKYVPLLLLLAVHLTEYFLKAKPIAEEKGIDRFEAFVNCLAFGFTWWLPLKSWGK